MVANITSLMDFSIIIGALLRSNLNFQLCASNASVFTVTLKGTGNPGLTLHVNTAHPWMGTDFVFFSINLRTRMHCSAQPHGFFLQSQCVWLCFTQCMGCPRDVVQCSLSLILGGVGFSPRPSHCKALCWLCCPEPGRLCEV